MLYESPFSKNLKLLLWEPTDSSRTKALRSFIFILLALAFHILLLALPWDHLFKTASLPKSLPVELTPIDSNSLAEIKKSWQEKPLILDQAHLPSAQTAPENARFMSSKNIRVEKEQQARHSQVLPQANRNAPAHLDHPKNTPPPSTKPAQKATQEKIALNQLGIPLYLTNNAKPSPQRDSSKNIRNTSSQSTGGDQAILDKTLPFGAENLLNTQESQFYNYYSRIYERIGPLWQSRMHQLLRSRQYPRGSYYSQVEVILDQEGMVRNIEIINSSGIADFDELIIRAWRELRQFPHPPQQIIKDGRITTAWSFQVNLEEGLRWSTPPPSRDY